eukprot:Skav201018  [mRNA]  locus=scaffold991:470047:470676:- [translate_table: standard]
MWQSGLGTGMSLAAAALKVCHGHRPTVAQVIKNGRANPMDPSEYVEDGLAPGPVHGDSVFIPGYSAPLHAAHDCVKLGSDGQTGPEDEKWLEGTALPSGLHILTKPVGERERRKRSAFARRKKDSGNPPWQLWSLPVASPALFILRVLKSGTSGRYPGRGAMDLKFKWTSMQRNKQLLDPRLGPVTWWSCTTTLKICVAEGGKNDRLGF